MFVGLVASWLCKANASERKESQLSDSRAQKGKCKAKASERKQSHHSLSRFFFQLRKRRQPKFANPCPTEAPPGPRIAQPRRGLSHNYVNKIRHAEPAPACLRKRLPPRQLRHRGISRHETGRPARPNGLYDDGKRPTLHRRKAATACRHGFCKHLSGPPPLRASHARLRLPMRMEPTPPTDWLPYRTGCPAAHRVNFS